MADDIVGNSDGDLALNLKTNDVLFFWLPFHFVVGNYGASDKLFGWTVKCYVLYWQDSMC